jgi:hypothetical protein
LFWSREVKKSLLAALACLSLGSAWAGEGYVGGALGSSHFSVDCSYVYRCSTSDVGLKLYGGLQVNQSVALEVGYTDFGQFDYGSNGVDVSALTLGVALRAPLARNVDVVGRLGVALMTTQGAGYWSHRSEDHAQLLAGVALEMPINKRWKAEGGLDLTKFEYLGDSGSMYMLHLGVQYGF